MLKTFRKMDNSFLKGCQIILKGYQNQEIKINQNDEKSLHSDWKAIGNDIKNAIIEYGKNY